MKNLFNKLTWVLVLLLVLTTLTACGRAKDRDIEKDNQTDIEGGDPLSDEVNELGDDLEGVDDLEDLEDPNIDPEDLEV